MTRVLRFPVLRLSPAAQHAVHHILRKHHERVYVPYRHPIHDKHKTLTRRATHQQKLFYASIINAIRHVANDTIREIRNRQAAHYRRDLSDWPVAGVVEWITYMAEGELSTARAELKDLGRMRRNFASMHPMNAASLDHALFNVQTECGFAMDVLAITRRDVQTIKLALEILNETALHLKHVWPGDDEDEITEDSHNEDEGFVVRFADCHS